VLLLRPDHIGDVVLTSAAVELLRTSLPHAHVTYVVGPWSVDAARCGPHVDELRTLDYPGFTRRRKVSLIAPYVLLLRQAWRLWREQYDAAIVFRPDHWWGALLVAAARIPLRIGFATPETQLLLTHCRPVRHGEHTAEQAIGLARLALQVLEVEARDQPKVRFEVPADARQTAAGVWSANRLEGRAVVVVQPTAGAQLKSWPIECWTQLIDALAKDGLAVVLTGAPADADLLERIRQRCTNGPIVVSGQSIAHSAAIYARARLVVGLDGGGAHIAAAVGTPTVRLYGPAPVSKYGPWPPRDDQRVLVTRALACVPCGQLADPPCSASALPACMLALSVQDVLHEVRSVLLSQG
jgi:ADP-heptose:LPS heptosyltransferase